MATQEVSFIPIGAMLDSHVGGGLQANNRQAYVNIVVGPGEGKGSEPFQDSFHRLEIAGIPIGAEVLKAKSMQIVAIAVNPTSNAPLLRVALVEPDGWWNYGYLNAGQQSYTDVVHMLMRVRTSTNAKIYWSAQQPFGEVAEFNAESSAAFNSVGFGMKFEAEEVTQTLDHVIAPVWRTVGGAAADRVFGETTLYCKVYSPVSASDPRPGALLATSDPKDWTTLQIGEPGTLPEWPKFTFPVGEQIDIESGEEYVVVVDYVGDGRWMYWRMNDDASGGPPEEDQGFLPVAGEYTVFTGDRNTAWNGNLYPRDDHMPRNHFAGTGFTGSFRGTLVSVEAYEECVWEEGGYSPSNAELPGFISMLQSFLDDPRYDPDGDGTPLGIWVDTADPDIGADMQFLADHWSSPNFDGMRLTIEYAEPVPGKATNPSPAHLATGVSEEPELGWTTGSYAGTGAITHKVYFGTTPSLGGGDYQGEQPGNTFSPGLLDLGRKHYWRIDEVGEFETTTGDTWEFTVRLPELPVPTAFIVVPVNPLTTDPGVDLHKPATPDLVPDLPDGLVAPATPQLEVSPPPALVSPPGAALELVKSDEDTALETSKSSDLAETEPGVSIEVNRGKLE